jgi:multidrug resistance efflux pump
MPEARSHRPLFSVLATVMVVVAAVLLGWFAWNRYESAPWTRDARVRAYAVFVAPEVSGRILAVPVEANEYVRAGQMLMRIDPRDFRNRLDEAKARLAANQATAQVKAQDAARRLRLSSSVVSSENKETAQAASLAANAAVTGAQAVLNEAALNLRRTVVRAPVSGWVTNLLVHPGDYAHTGAGALTIVDARTFWVTAYFEETELTHIKPGMRARIRLMADPGHVLTGHVQGIGHGIITADARPAANGLPIVNPIYSWVRLAQRIPVHITIDHVPPGITLAAGLTGTVRVVEPAHIVPR